MGTRILAPWAVLVSALSLLTACKQSGTVVTPVRFDRPRALAFACFDAGEGLFVERSRCEGLEEISTETVGLTALVAQTARGEIAAVDLRDGQVLDSDPVVPGFTFRRVGIDPVAIVVPPDAPATTYVASRGSRTVEWMPTAEFRPDALGPASSSGQVVLPRGAPSDLVLAPDGSALYAPLPDASAVAILPILADGSLDAATLVDVDGAIPAAVAGPDAVDTFERFCPVGAEPRPIGAVIPRDTAAYEGLAPAPSSVIVDADASELWVADERLPVVHRFSITTGALTALPGLNVGAPLAALAMSPVVPATLGDAPESAPARYLYGLDAEDGEVLVADALAGSTTFGAVLPVNAGLESGDRIHFSARARTLAVMDTGSGGSECVPGAGSDEETDAGPDTLRGVFLAVGLADGSARIVDVYDLDASCRGGASCADPLNAFDLLVSIRRHEPRVGSLLAEAVALGANPTFSFETNPGVLNDDGHESTHTGPGLSVLDACPAHMVSVWPGSGVDAVQPVVCASNDPWELSAERWAASWEGALPGVLPPGLLLEDLDGSAGPFLSLAGPGVCARGALGAQEVSLLGAEDPMASYGGDAVVVTSDLPVLTADDPACAAFVTPSDGSERAPVGFVIESASDDRLLLGAPLGDYDFAQVQGCFPGRVDLQLRSHGAYTVTGSASGFVHRMIAAPDGRCVPDPELAPVAGDARSYRSGRAFAGTVFDNGSIAFRIQHDDAVPSSGAHAVLLLSLSQVPPGLGVSMRGLETAGTPAVVDALVWSPTNQSLFGVDGLGDRLVQMRTDPFRVVRALR